MILQKKPHYPSLTLVDDQKIWDSGEHNAFTDLLFTKEKWFCIFREGSGHISPDGALRVLQSIDGKKWESAALLQHPQADLRDGKLSISPEGRLMICAGAAWNNIKDHTHQTMIWFSENGIDWEGPQEVGDPDFWIWRPIWHQEQAWGAAYDCRRGKAEYLYAGTLASNKSASASSTPDQDNQIVFERVGKNLCSRHFPNEASLHFFQDTLFCLLRRDWKSATALIGKAAPPYTHWKWRNLKVRIGGPNMIILPSGKILAAVRLYKPKAHTSLCWIDEKKGRLVEALPLPSGGDTSYAGMVLQGNMLYLSYYSSHEGKTAIYTAKIVIHTD
jgi:hypothetical protein